MAGFDETNLAPPLAQDKAQALRQMGMLDDNVYNRMYPVADAIPPIGAGVPPVAPAPLGAALPPPPIPMAPTSPSLDTMPVNTPVKELDFVDKMASDVNAEKESQEAVKKTEARDMAEKQLKLQQDIMNYKIKSDLKDGLSPDKVREKYASDAEKINLFKKDNGLDEAVMQPASFSTGKSVGEGPTSAPLANEVQIGNPEIRPSQPQVPQTNPLTAGFELQKQALVEGAQAGVKKAAEESAYMNTAVAEDKKRIAAMEAQNVQQDNLLADQQGQLRQSIDNMAAMKVDPERFWNNKSTGDKVLTGIGLFLGAFGRGGNKAVAVIQNAIDQDIAAQKSNIDTAKGKIAGESGLYSDMLARFKNKSAAADASRAAYLSNAKLQLDQIATKYKNPELKAKAMELYGQLDVQQKVAETNFARTMAAQNQVQVVDPTMAKILALPDDLKKRALDEYGQAQGWNQLKEDVVNTFSTSMKTGQSGRIPSAFGGSSEAYKAAKGKIAGAVVGKVPGIKSDSDFENIVAPMLPNPGETPEAAAKKLEIFKGFLKANAPASPLLRGLNLEPKSVSEQLGASQGFAK